MDMGSIMEIAKMFMQKGGRIPRYSNGGYTGVPILDERKYISEMYNAREAHDKAYDVDRKNWETSVTEAESGMSGFGGNVLDVLTPGFLEGPLASWATGVPNTENWSSAPRQRMENYFGEIAPHVSDVPSQVQMTPELMSMKYSLEDMPTAPSSRGISNEALKKKVREASGDFNAADFLESMYGSNWWSGQ